MIFLGCGDDDSITLTTCSGEDTYALDYRPLFFQDTRIWLTEADGDVGFDEPLNNLTFGIQFLNFDDACEDEYTVSLASYQQGGGSSPVIIAENLFVNEYASVPSGSVLDQSSATRTFGAVVNFQSESTIIIRDCPPIDSVMFWLNSTTVLGQENDPPYEFEYASIDNTLLITTDAAQVTASDVIVAIRREQEQDWYGLDIDAIGTSLGRNVSFTELKPLELRPTSVAWPSNISLAEIELRWINSISSQRTTIVSLETEEVETLMPLLPSEAGGPFLVTAKWTKDQERYESAQVLMTWPSQIVISSQLDGQVNAYTYPTMELTSSGADIVEINGLYNRSDIPELCFRSYTSPLVEGTQTLRFPYFSPRLRDERLDRVYEGALQENVTISFYHYPGMNGSYSWYLRNVHSQQGTGETWLQSLAYELLTLSL
ncbi:MAG: hypothetical protein AAFP77_20790 [Bacteroidota bacterium]